MSGPPRHEEGSRGMVHCPLVMARLVPTGCTHLVSQSERTWFGGRDGQCVPLISATGAATDGPDAPGHDGWGMSAAPAMALICLTGAEMCECRRDEPGHDEGAKILLRPPPYPDTHGRRPGIHVWRC